MRKYIIGIVSVGLLGSLLWLWATRQDSTPNVVPAVEVAPLATSVAPPTSVRKSMPARAVLKPNRKAVPPTDTVLPLFVDPELYDYLIEGSDFGEDIIYRLEFQLGLNAYLDRCAGPHIRATGNIFYFVEWPDIKEDGLGSTPNWLDGTVPNEGWSPEEVSVFKDCVVGYLADNPYIFLPAERKNGLDHLSASMQTKFPIANEWVYERLRQARTAVSSL